MNAEVQLPGLPDGVDQAVVVAQMIRRARSAGFDAWWQRVEAIGFCANPVHLAGRAGPRTSGIRAMQQPTSGRLPLLFRPVRP